MRRWMVATALLVSVSGVLGYATSPKTTAEGDERNTQSLINNVTKYWTDVPNFASNVQVRYSQQIGRYDYVIVSYDKGTQHLWSEMIGRRTTEGKWDEIGIASPLPHRKSAPIENLIISMPTNYTMIGGVVNDKSIKTVRLVMSCGNVFNAAVNDKGAYCYILQNAEPKSIQGMKVEGYSANGHLVYSIQR
jgi:hypothetical protein